MRNNSLQGSTGLLHLAILLPSRQDLAHWLQHFISKNKRLDGAGDHLVSEALYLRSRRQWHRDDFDRPRDSWTFDENGVKMATPWWIWRDCWQRRLKRRLPDCQPETTMGHAFEGE
ncbi:MAG: hypothetical protein R3C26_06340 [Calditrichia bacterium]